MLSLLSMNFLLNLALHSFIDYDTMYQKGFIDPLQGILDVIGWKTEKASNTIRLLHMTFLNELIKEIGDEHATLAADIERD